MAHFPLQLTLKILHGRKQSKCEIEYHKIGIMMVNALCFNSVDVKNWQLSTLYVQRGIEPTKGLTLRGIVG